MRKLALFALIILVFLFSSSCSTRTLSDVDIDISTRKGKAPLSVVAYVFFNIEYECATLRWIYWYKGFETDKNEMDEKVCGAKVATHEFGFLSPGQANILVYVKIGEREFSRRFTVLIGESLPSSSMDLDKD